MNPALTIAANAFRVAEQLVPGASQRSEDHAIPQFLPITPCYRKMRLIMTDQQLTGGQMIVDCLIREGVERVFPFPGHGDTALLDAFVDRADEIEVVPAMHEQGAAHMADGYYRASGKIAAVCTSIGPGATNTLTGLVTAFADSQPFILITGAVPHLHGKPGGARKSTGRTEITSRAWRSR